MSEESNFFTDWSAIINKMGERMRNNATEKHNAPQHHAFVYKGDGIMDDVFCVEENDCYTCTIASQTICIMPKVKGDYADCIVKKHDFNDTVTIWIGFLKEQYRPALSIFIIEQRQGVAPHVMD